MVSAVTEFWIEVAKQVPGESFFPCANSYRHVRDVTMGYGKGNRNLSDARGPGASTGFNNALIILIFISRPPMFTMSRQADVPL
jgi:hypothetical protein